MIEIDKDGIAQELAHRQEMLRRHRDRLREFELREAMYGSTTPPEVKMEIRDLTEKIERDEAEILRLRAEAVVDKESVVEVEYRVLLAEAWDTPRGRPTVAGSAKLELARLRLGITPERAHELEQDIRRKLASEAFDAISLLDLDDTIHALNNGDSDWSSQIPVQVIDLIKKSIWLDPAIMLEIFGMNLASKQVVLERLRQIMLPEYARGWSDDRVGRIEDFLAQLPQEIEQYQS